MLFGAKLFNEMLIYENGINFWLDLLDSSVQIKSELFKVILNLNFCLFSSSVIYIIEVLQHVKSSISL